VGDPRALAVPVMMSLAYTLLAATSETNTAGKAWMASACCSCSSSGSCFAR